MNQHEANWLLSYSVRMLKYKEFRAIPHHVLRHSYAYYRELKDAGFWWQAQKLAQWIRTFRWEHRGCLAIDCYACQSKHCRDTFLKQVPCYDEDCGSCPLKIKCEVSRT